MIGMERLGRGFGVWEVGLRLSDGGLASVSRLEGSTVPQ